MLFLYANGNGGIIWIIHGVISVEEPSSTIQLEYEEDNLIQSNSQENQSCWDVRNVFAYSILENIPINTFYM